MTGQMPEVLIKVLVGDTEVEWRQLARCRDGDIDPELFFPVGDTAPAKAQEAEAKAICALCPVTDECLAWSQETGQDAGVWGGLAEGERRKLRRGQRRRVKVTVGGTFIHGTTYGYDNRGCRCPACKKAKADYRKRRRPA